MPVPPPAARRPAPQHRPARSGRARAAGAVGTALALTAALGGCGDGAPAGADRTVHIGMLASLTGTYGSVGKEMRDGFTLYLDTHGGRLGGRRVALSTADEGDGAPTAVPAARRLIERHHIDALTGLVGGGSVNKVRRVTSRRHIPLLGTGGRPDVPGKDLTYVWHTSFLSDEPGTAIARYVKKEAGGPVYAIGPDYRGGYDEMKGFTDAFRKAGGTLANPGGKTTWTPFPRTRNFLPYLNAIPKTGAKAVYCFYGGRAAVDFVRAYKRSAAARLPLYSAGFLTEGSALTAEGKAADGVHSVLNYVPDLDNEANRKFAADWASRHHTSPSTSSMAGYDSAAVLDKAVAAAGRGGGRVTPKTINRAIAGLGRIDSPRGPWEFGRRSHAPVQKWYLRQVRRDGKQLANVTVQDLALLGG